MRFHRPRASSRKARQDSAREHVAKPAVGGGHELIGSRDRPYSSRPRHVGRFRWVVAGLFVLAACSLAAAVVLTASKRRASAVSSGSGIAWSTWRPADNGLAGAQEIADYLAPYYRATPAAQLAVVTVVNLNNPSAPVHVVVPTGSSNSLLALPPGGTIVYNLCGEGSRNCSIGVGKPSADRLLLLRREALELALYTFRYISGTQFVVAILPPGYTVQRGTASASKAPRKAVTKPLDLAIAFARSELQPWLSQPLRAALPESLPPTVSEMPHAREAELVSVLTSHGMYSETTSQAQDDSTVITLSGPLQPQ
jgi:hypothetical protein